MSMAWLDSDVTVNAEQVRLAEGCFHIFELCVFELACISFCYVENNDSGVLRFLVDSSISEPK